MMAAIRSKGNKSTEIALIILMRSSGLSGWRRNSMLPGKPDFIFPRPRVAIFVDGCFWHGCPKCFVPPKSRQEYWEPKIARNKKRDRRVKQDLELSGWKVVRVWEHEFKQPTRLIGKLRRVICERLRRA